MKQKNNWIGKLSIRKKLIFYSYLVFAPILVLISVLLFIHNYRNVMENEEAACIANVQSLSDSIDSIQNTVMELGTYISINTDIGNILTADDPPALNADGQLWLHHAPMQIIQDIIAINGEIKTIAIYPENGVSPFLRCMDSSAYTDFDTIKTSEVYANAVENKGKALWRRVMKYSSDVYTANYTEKIVMFREIYDMARKNKLGFLVIGSSAERFDKICQTFLRDDREAIIIISGDGAELVRCGGVDPELLAAMLAQRENRHADSFPRRWKYMNYNIYEYGNKGSGTTTIKMVPQIAVQDILETILVTPVAFLFGFLIGLYPIMVLVSNIISKPLKNLAEAMKEFKKGDFSQRVEVTTMDEVGQASACFNEMVDEMKQLIDRNYVMALREKESELDVLQAQINPHFLYNALDSLYWETTEAGNDKVAEDIMALSDLFRLVLSRGEGIVSVRNECELLERYLQIQKMRFGKKLEYRISMEETIWDEKIPKLILQPFVENAIVHGFEKGGRPFRLSVTGRRADRYMVFVIEDTGVGMSPEQVEAIWRQEDSRQYAGQRVGRYAIKNVKERLELKYYDDFKLCVESQQGHGTMVTLRVPVG